MTHSPRKLYRSRSQSMIAGVCGGLALYFNIDVTLVRIIFFVALISGLPLLAYILLWIFIPLEY